MARPKQFDREEKLIDAMSLFWRKGYADTSLADLVEHLKINRFSIYSTFGDKTALYHEALNYYLETMSLPTLNKLRDEGKSVDDIIAYIASFVALQKEQSVGCFMQNALLEKAISDPVVMDLVETLFNAIDDAFRHVLAAAVERGELLPETEIAQVSRFLLLQMQGIRVLGKARQYEHLSDAFTVMKAQLEAMKR